MKNPTPEEMKSEAIKKVYDDDFARVHTRTADEPDKGDYNGSCNVTACQRPGAIYLHRANGKHYCRKCATRINSDPFNARDCETLYGVGELLIRPVENPHQTQK